MKKLLLSLTFSLCVLSLFAAEPQSDDVSSYSTDSLTIVRSGNEYVTNQKIMNKKEFMNFLAAHDQEAFQYFSKGYTLSNVGWGLFAGSFPSVVLGAVFSAYSEGITIGMPFCTLGIGMFVAGVVCLSIGYEKMHSAHTFYTLRNGKRHSFNLSVAPSTSCLGLALNF